MATKRMFIRGLDIVLKQDEDEPEGRVELYIQKEFEGVFDSHDEAVNYVKNDLLEKQGGARAGRAGD